MTNETKEKVSKEKVVFKTIRRSPISIATIIVLVVIASFFFKNYFAENNSTIIDVSNVLKDEKVISELSTLIVPYNSIYVAEEPSNNGTDENIIKYYVAYEGTVTFGFNLENVKSPKIDENEKKIEITLPKMTILEYKVDHNSIDIIYNDEKYNKEAALFAIQQECDNDLKSKSEKDDRVFQLAKESAEDTIRNLISPIVNREFKNYDIVFKWEEDYEKNNSKVVLFNNHNFFSIL